MVLRPRFYVLKPRFENAALKPFFCSDVLLISSTFLLFVLYWSFVYWFLVYDVACALVACSVSLSDTYII